MTSKSLSEFTFDECEKSGAINKFEYEFYQEFIDLSDETMTLIIEQILKMNGAEINNMLFDTLLPSKEIDKKIYGMVRTSLSLMSMGVLGFQEDGILSCFKPDGPAPSEAMRKELNQKIETSLQFIPKALMEVVKS